ncbi:hypothetical protein G6F31_016587 [Rhizopus arrhizus]|nr:hypothetical protein G6F31_016587 [Rhizopus arrhizus]
MYLSQTLDLPLTRIGRIAEGQGKQQYLLWWVPTLVGTNVSGVRANPVSTKVDTYQSHGLGWHECVRRPCQHRVDQGRHLPKRGNYTCGTGAPKRLPPGVLGSSRNTSTTRLTTGTSISRYHHPERSVSCSLRTVTAISGTITASHSTTLNPLTTSASVLEPV